MKHPTKIIKYNGTLKELADDIGNLRYDALSELLRLLSDKIYDDSLKDKKNNKPLLSSKLCNLSELLSDLHIKCNRIWKICGRHMDDV